MRNLLAKTRSINKVLQKSAGYPVDFKEISAILSENIECSIYILDRRGKVLGYSYLKGFVCDVMENIVESPAGFRKNITKTYCGLMKLTLIFVRLSTSAFSITTRSVNTVK